MGMILLIRKRTLLYTWLAVCMIGLSAIFLAGSRRAFTPTGAMGQGSSAQTVVIDPGHGGQDGGAVAADGTAESEVNLAVSLRLDSGVTLSYLMRVLEARGANSIRLCTLLSKPERHKVEVPIDYLGFEIPDEFVVGYGLDYAEKYRNLPYIGILKPEVYGG